MVKPQVFPNSSTKPSDLEQLAAGSRDDLDTHPPPAAGTGALPASRGGAKLTRVQTEAGSDEPVRSGTAPRKHDGLGLALKKAGRG